MTQHVRVRARIQAAFGRWGGWINATLTAVTVVFDSALVRLAAGPRAARSFSLTPTALSTRRS
jgi:hypothetical protein